MRTPVSPVSPVSPVFHRSERPLAVTVVSVIGVVSGLGMLANAGSMLPLLLPIEAGGLGMRGSGWALGSFILGAAAVGVVVAALLIAASIALFRAKHWGRVVLELMIWGSVAVVGGGALFVGPATGQGAFVTLVLVGSALIGSLPLIGIGCALRTEKVEEFMRHG